MMYNGKKSASIKGLWNILSFECVRENGPDGSKCEGKMDLTQQGTRLACECRKCRFGVPYPILEKFVDKISKAIVNDASEGIEVNLTGYKGKEYDRSKDIFFHFVVLEHKWDIIRIGVWK